MSDIKIPFRPFFREPMLAGQKTMTSRTKAMGKPGEWMVYSETDGRRGMSERPNKEDRDALRLLLQREDLSDFDGEFVEALRNWRGNWTERQASYFDRVWEKYYA